MSVSTTSAPIVLDSADKSVKPLLCVIRKTVDVTMTGPGRYATYVASHGVTVENLKSHADALAALAYPSDEPVQAKDGKRTRYGVTLNTIKTGLKRALSTDDDAPKPITLRVSLSGEGGGSTTVPVDHPLYAQIIALIGADAS